MNEERFNRLEQMMTDMMRMVAATNAEVGKLSTRVNAIEDHLVNLTEKVHVQEKRFDTLEGRFDAMENRFDGLENRFDGLEAKVERLEAKVDKNHQELLEKVSSIEERIGILAERELHNTAEIVKLKRARASEN